ncbi:MAG TPA: hypothetical protein DSN98_04595 [Thermoplasmata archaeon]|jgi:hypothetical protein|nr:MAG TPA: hypothetical protein DSN98_04595 [Thermoplasmata archaeon]
MYLRHKQKIMLGVSLLVVACLVGSGTYVYLEYLSTKKVTPVQQAPQTIDNRISPLENQGVVLEILRIRDRGLLDKLMKPGNSWKNKPSFYFVTNMDGLEYVSKDVTQHGRTTEVLFNTWDTMFQENKIMKDAEEEQEKSTITLTIMEQVKSGLLGRKTQNIPRDSLTVTYDYRTGRWSGSDNFNDKDGYGHFLGETFEIWFNVYQIDYDGDFIPYWTEVNILGTDPTVDDSKLDPDGDGIPTAWEWKWGYDPFTWDDHANLDPDMDGISNLNEYKLEKWLANPFVQNIYYEVDIMGSGGLFDPPHYFLEESKQGIIERFARNNIQVFFDDGWPDSPPNGGGQMLPHIAKISQDSGMMLQFYDHYFPDERKGVFRYLVIGHGGGFQHPSKNNVYDTTQIAYISAKFKPKQQIFNFVVMGLVPTERGVRISLGSLILHEMAHSCSVDADNCAFGGIDNVSYGIFILPNKQYKATWGQYHSVLNYMYTNGVKTFDLSHGENGPPYDQNDWGLMFCGYFKYNANLIEEPYYEPKGGETLVKNEWLVTGYTYDANLTAQYMKKIGDWSPIDPIKVNWSVYKLIDKEKNPNFPEIRVYAQPRIKTTRQWVLNQNGALDSEGNLKFYSFDELSKEKTKTR